MIHPADLSEEDLEEIVQTFTSVEICDETCLTIFVKNKWALHKTVEWAKEENLLIKRAAFVIMIGLAKDAKETENFVFRVFLPILLRERQDTRAEIQEVIIEALTAIAARNKSLHTSVKDALKETPATFSQKVLGL